MFIANYDESGTCDLTIRENEFICYKKYLRLPVANNIDELTVVKRIPDNFRVQYKDIVEHAKGLLEV